MVAVTLIAIVSVALFDAYQSAKKTRERIDRDLAEVADTLANSTFPLSDAVLRQMRGLSGADFVVVDQAGENVLSSSAPGVFPARPQLPPASPDEGLRLSGPIQIGDENYFHTSVVVRRPNQQESTTTLHIYYPEESYEQAWRDVVFPPLVVAAITMLLVIIASFAIASRVTRPLVQLQKQVGEIASGEFKKMQVPPREDEIADLSKAINQMAEKLSQYEQDVRRHEQLRTLGQLGGGIAHQMRNSVTGCKLALELHSRECDLADGSESFSVVHRQLALMENYLQRFLALGKVSTGEFKQTDLQTVVESAITLIEPTAKHLGVAIRQQWPELPLELPADRVALEQSLVNILLNGVEAAAGTTTTETNAPQNAVVHVRLARESDNAVLEIQDSGPGPAEALHQSLVDPFVSDKPDGVGLGLAIAQETIQAHQGELSWSRRDDLTCFRIVLPLTIRT